MAWKQGRGVSQGFARTANQHLGQDCVVLCLLPWTEGRPPESILVPRSVDNGTLSDEEILNATASRHTVLVPCTFEAPEEEVAAHRILPLFTSCEHVCVFIVHLLPEGLTPSRQNSELIMRRHDAMLATGVDDVFMDPDTEPQALRRTINLARATWELNVQRMQLMLDAEPDPVTPESMRLLQTQHQRLLWESIPRVLMPHFAPLDRNLPETGQSVGNYRLLRRFETCSGTVLQAADNRNNSAAIKVIDKVKVCTPGELEGLYREFRFLCEIIKHPNITKCLGMMHSTARVYLIFEFAGNQNLAQALAARPGQRFDEEDSLNMFDQVGKGLSHCHAHDVCHRNLSLEHVVLSQLPGTDRHRCRLVDFHSAMVARGQTTSRTICGTLPCIAPEMATGGPYIPRLTDCWSAGIVLLETAGGMTSLSRSVPYQQAEARQVAGSIQSYFMLPNSHERALAFIGAVQSRRIVAILQDLVCPTPENRKQLRDLVSDDADKDHGT
mmetsp:Transcript_6772/g.16965  ORF Transcript_6772/g.16965 Transcript_6772/m.16965 type:complete len:498 (-) Transcript_6772:130-1623(-)